MVKLARNLQVKCSRRKENWRAFRRLTRLGHRWRDAVASIWVGFNRHPHSSSDFCFVLFFLRPGLRRRWFTSLKIIGRWRYLWRKPYLFRLMTTLTYTCHKLDRIHNYLMSNVSLLILGSLDVQIISLKMNSRLFTLSEARQNLK